MDTPNSAPGESSAPRVLHVFGGAVRSGVESVVLELSEGLRQQGGEPILVPIAEGVFSEEARALGFAVRPLGKLRRYDIGVIHRLARLMRELRPDIVHSHGVNGAFYACPAAWLAGHRRHVNTFHADTREVLVDVYRHSLPRNLAHHYHLFLARRCTRVSVVDDTLRRDLIRSGVDAEKIVYIPNAVDVDTLRASMDRREAVREEFAVAAGTVLIGTIGRLAPVKNIPMLLRVAAELVRAGRDVRFLVAGVGPDAEMLAKLSAELGVADHVHFTGWRDDVPALLAALDVFLMTSTSEACPVALQGAMAEGKAIVSTAVGFLREPGPLHELGLVVDSGDVAGMLRALESLLAEPAAAARAGEVGREMLQREFSRDRVWRQFQEFYAGLMAEPADPSSG